MTPLQVAEKSPEFVGRHERQAWLDLFHPQGEVHDPHGAPGHSGAGIGAFWDTFIAKNGIRFEVHHDIVVGQQVWRDLTIHTTLSTGPVLKVPCHLLYEIEGDRVKRLVAHWELASMIWQATLLGPFAWFATTVMSLSMLLNQGPVFIARYMASMFGVGAKGKAAARTWAAENGVELGPKILACADRVTASATVEGEPAVLLFQFRGGQLEDVQTCC